MSSLTTAKPTPGTRGEVIAASHDRLEPEPTVLDSLPAVAPISGPKEGRGAQLSMEFAQGPFPPPKMLEGYERLSPGLALKLVDHGISEGQHRRELERKQTTAIYNIATHAQWLTASVLVLLSLSVFYMIYAGHAGAAAASVASITGGVALIYVFRNRGGRQRPRMLDVPEKESASETVDSKAT